MKGKSLNTTSKACAGPTSILDSSFYVFLNLMQLFHFTLAKIKLYLDLKILLYPLHHLSAQGKECDQRAFPIVG